MTVTIELMNAGKEADDYYWAQYIRSVHPDDQQYIPYHYYLSLKLREESTDAEGVV